MIGKTRGGSCRRLF